MPNNETKVLDEDGAILLTSNIKTLADATYPANAAVASPYNSSISYIVGSYCLHNGLLYKCNTDIPVGGEVWTAAHWTQVNLGNELALDRKMQFTSVVVDKASFVDDTTYEDFPYRAAITLTGVTASMYPEVVFDATDAVSGQFAPTVLSYNGGIYIYAKKQPNTSITIPSIVCWIRGIALDSAGSLNIADEIASIEDNIDNIEGDIETIQSDVLNIQNDALKIELLWTNASPESSFAAQTISIDLSNYIAIIILINGAAKDTITSGQYGLFPQLVMVNETVRTIMNWTSSATNNNGSRYATATNSGIVFGDDVFNNGTQNGYGVPYKIYGIKGAVTT